MPFADPEKRRQYDADFKRKARAAEPCPTRLALPVEFRAKTAADVLVRRGVFNEQLDTLRQDNSLGSVERAKAVGALVSNERGPHWSKKLNQTPASIAGRMEC